MGWLALLRVQLFVHLRLLNDRQLDGRLRTQLLIRLRPTH